MTVSSKLLIIALTLWAVCFPEAAFTILSNISYYLLTTFNVYYIYVVTAFLVFSIIVALLPASGRCKLGKLDELPEFSNFSWFSMMFGAGMGIGLMVFSTAEPLWHFEENPEIINSQIEPYTLAAVQSAFRYAFLHFGLHPWAIYVVTGLSLGFFAHRYRMPLTIRTALVPLLGKHLNGYTGHLLDITAIIATLLGIAVTIGFGIQQLIAGFSAITEIEWTSITDQNSDTPETARPILLLTLSLVMFLSIVSAATGVDRGIKLLSNLNLSLSFLLLLVFLIFGPFIFLLELFGRALMDYLLSLPKISIEVFDPDTAAGRWQAQGTIFYWAWWIAFAPFVGLFLARISKGRTIREFVFGAMLVPAAMCFIWVALLGGTAIYLELSGAANTHIIHAPMSAQLFETLHILLSSTLFKGLAFLIMTLTVVLILTFLITSADSGVLILNTIMSGGSNQFDLKHKIIWGVILTAVIAALLISGGGSLAALQKAMIIGALPFSMVMILMCLSLTKGIIRGNKQSD